MIRAEGYEQPREKFLLLNLRRLSGTATLSYRFVPGEYGNEQGEVE